MPLPKLFPRIWRSEAPLMPSACLKEIKTFCSSLFANDPITNDAIVQFTQDYADFIHDHQRIILREHNPTNINMEAEIAAECHIRVISKWVVRLENAANLAERLAIANEFCKEHLKSEQNKPIDTTAIAPG